MEREQRHQKGHSKYSKNRELVSKLEDYCIERALSQKVKSTTFEHIFKQLFELTEYIMLL